MTPARRHDVDRYFTGLAALSLMAFWLGYQSLLVQSMVTTLHMNDFGKFYYSAQRFLEGGDPYGPSPATLMPVGPDESRQFWNLNPPHFHLLILPLARLSEVPALIAWFSAGLAALVASILVIASDLGLRWTPRRLLLTTFAVIASSATGAVMLTGQMTFLLLLPVTLAWRAARGGRWLSAAVLLGVLAGIKPLFGVFLIYLVARRHFRAAVAMASASAAGFAIGLVAFGWPAHVSWARAMASADWPWAMMNGSLLGLFSRTLAPSPYFTPFVDWPAVVVPVWLIAAAGVVGAAAWTLRVPQPSSQREGDAAFAVLLVTAQLISPMGWIYYLPLVAGPLVALWVAQEARSARSGLRDAAIALAAPGLLCPVGVALLWRHTAIGTLTLGSIFAWTTLWLGVAVTAHLRSADVHA